MAEIEKIDKELYHYDPVWQVQLVVIIALVFQVILPNKFSIDPKWILPTLEVILLLALVFTTPKEARFESRLRRLNSIALIALISAANIYSLFRAITDLLARGHISDGQVLVFAAINIFLTNIIIFALWYWELDGGGPGRRNHTPIKDHDFLFPQMDTPEIAADNWKPAFFDYLYVSVTNATAFSPTDTMPLRHRAKLLMGIQSIVSVMTLAILAARAVNIL